MTWMSAHMRCAGSDCIGFGSRDRESGAVQDGAGSSGSKLHLLPGAAADLHLCPCLLLHTLLPKEVQRPP